MKQKPVHGKMALGNLFSGKEDSKTLDEKKVEKRVALTEDDARKIAEKLLQVDHSIDNFRKQIEECAGLHDRKERVNSILWEMQKQGKSPDFAMKLLLQDISEGKKPRSRYDDSQFYSNAAEVTEDISSSKPISDNGITLEQTQDNQLHVKMTVTEKVVIEKFKGVKPGEDHGHKANTAPPVQKEKSLKDKDFFEPIKAAISKTRRETEETIKQIFGHRFEKK